jgi:hypothetical protein
VIDDAITFQFLVSTSVFFSSGLLYVIGFLKSSSFRHSIASIIAVLLGVAFGLRSASIGLDSQSYASWFELGEVNNQSVGEYLFYLLISITRLFFNDYTVFFVIIASISNLLMLNGLRKITVNYLLAFSIFITSFVFFNVSTNIIRQGLAISIVIYALGAHLSGKQYIGFFLIAVATLIHATAIAFFPLFFLIKSDNSISCVKYFLILMIIMTIISVVDILDYLANFSYYFKRLAWYFHWGVSRPWEVKHAYFLIIPFVLVLYSISSRLSGQHRKIVTALVYGLFLVVVFRFEEMVADRFFYYFVPMLCVMIVDLASRIRPCNISYGLLYFFASMWLIKTYFLQYPNWIRV